MQECPEWLSDPFFERVDVRGPDDCWEYRRDAGGSRGQYGHVRIWWNGQRDYAHRIAFRLAGGVIANGTICHDPCDNPPCCNPAHLIDGTPQDNVRQRDERGRRTPFLPRGADGPSAKLTEREVRAIRIARDEGLKLSVVARLFGVSKSTVSNVQRGVYYSNGAHSAGAA